MRPSALRLLAPLALAAATAASAVPPHGEGAGAADAIEGGAGSSPELVAAGRLPAATIDFLGDTLGSFSSLAVQPGSWSRQGDGRYSAVLWTLPDRGRNDPGSGLFYDYRARLLRHRLRIEPGPAGAAGRIVLEPDGGIVLSDFEGRPFTGADPGDDGLRVQRGVTLPSPARGIGAGKVALDAESLQFAADGGFYVGDEYTANVYRFDAGGRLAGAIVPPPAVRPVRDGRPAFGSLRAPDSGRRNNQGVEGMALSPNGRTLFVALQSALLQDSARGDPSARINIRVLVYDVSRDPTPQHPVGHYLVQLPAYAADGDGRADRAAAQSELRALDERRFLLLARDGNGLGAGSAAPPVYKRVLLVDLAGASNLAGSRYETTTASVLADPDDPSRPQAGIVPARWSELLDLLDPEQLARAGLHLGNGRGDDPNLVSEKWEAMDLVPMLDPDRPHDWLLLVGNDNDFIARRCTMQGQACDSAYDNDNRLLAYRLALPPR